MKLSANLYGVLADVTVVLHAGFVLFVVGGQILIMVGWLKRWQWVRGLVFRLAHVVAVGFVVVEAWFGIVCPLTSLENQLRNLAGVPVYEGTFIGYWAHKAIFYSAPHWLFTLAYTLFALVVLISLVGYPPKNEKISRTGP